MKKLQLIILLPLLIACGKKEIVNPDTNNSTTSLPEVFIPENNTKVFGKYSGLSLNSINNSSNPSFSYALEVRKSQSTGKFKNLPIFPFYYTLNGTGDIQEGADLTDYGFNFNSSSTWMKFSAQANGDNPSVFFSHSSITTCCKEYTNGTPKHYFGKLSYTDFTGINSGYYYVIMSIDKNLKANGGYFKNGSRYLIKSDPISPNTYTIAFEYKPANWILYRYVDIELKVNGNNVAGSFADTTSGYGGIVTYSFNLSQI